MRSLVLLILCASPAFAGPRVLLLWDVKNAQTEALAQSLRLSGDEVVYSETNGPGFTGDNPSLAGFDVVVHLNGTTFASDMPERGQQALVRFVQSGGVKV